MQQLSHALQTTGYQTIAAEPQDVDVVVWVDPLHRAGLFAAGPLHVVDLQGVRVPPRLGRRRGAAWRAEVATSCRGAALVLVGSDAEQGFWAAECGRAGFDVAFATVPFCPVVDDAPSDGTRCLAVLEDAPDQATLAIIGSAATLLAQHGWSLAVHVGEPGGLGGLIATRALRAVPGISVRSGPAPFGPGLYLDLRADTLDERVRLPNAVASALAHGMSVLSTVNGAVTQRIDARGVGALLSTDLQALACEWPRDRDAGACDLADEMFAVEATLDRLGVALAGCHDAQAARRDAWAGSTPAPQPLGPDAHVLVLSNEHPNLIDIRVHLPFGAMHRRGAIAGYTILREGKIVFSTRAADEAGPAHFDAIWVHRAHDSRMQLLIQALDRPFAYDIDDNLLATPSYRDPFPTTAIEAVHGFIHRSAVLSCSTEALAGLLQARAEGPMLDRVVVTPNLALRQPLGRPAGAPKAVIWASSDLPALTETREGVERAVRDFCLAHRLRLICLGAAPSARLSSAGLEVEHVGILPYAAYLEYLRALSPGILVCPLETTADAGTQAFVNGKSDIKALEAGMTGLVGVYSAALPYRQSDLAPDILSDNAYQSWLDGLERAYRACEQPGEPPQFPARRVVAEGGLMAWADALARARLPGRLFMDELNATLRYVEQRRARLLDAAEFDGAYYLEAHQDVRTAVLQGGISTAYEHYISAGYAEGRDTRALRNDGADAWWETLIQTVSRVEQAVAAREAGIAARQADRALQRSLR